MKFKWVGVAVAVLALVSTVAIAKRFNEVEHVYFNSKGEVVGGKTYYCGGQMSQWGVITTKQVSYNTPCD